MLPTVFLYHGDLIIQLNKEFIPETVPSCVVRPLPSSSLCSVRVWGRSVVCSVCVCSLVSDSILFVLVCGRMHNKTQTYFSTFAVKQTRSDSWITH